jgi:multidrug efflux pump subunit AcrA (membrane-fusion protein)
LRLAARSAEDTAMTTNKLIVAGALLGAAGLIGWRWLGHTKMEADHPIRSMAGFADPPAAVAQAERHNLGNVLTIAGEFKPFQDVEVHAKVAGYIRTINVDVGDHVKQGQTLAVLEVPELAAQLAGERTLPWARPRNKSAAPKAICSVPNRITPRHIRRTSG